MQEVLARGSAPLGEGGRAAARAAAIQQALRNALEQVVGVYVAGATVADKFLTLKDRVYTHSEGFVVPGEVVEETDDGTTLTVRMKVIVSLRPLLNRLKELGLTRNWKVAVAIREGAGTTAAGAAPIAETAIVQRLIRAGFQVVYLTGGDADDVETFLHSLRGERGAPAADVLILGTAAARLSERLPVTVGSRVVSSMAVYQGRVEARAIRVETGEVIASHLMDEMASSSNDSVAAGSALRGAARGAAGAFLDDILALPAGFTRRVQLEVYGFKKRSDAQALEDALPLLAGVRRVEYRNYADGQLVLELEIDSETAERLGSDLENARALKGLKLVVETDTKARIRARVTGT